MSVQDRIAPDRPFPPVEGVSHRFVTVRGVRFHVAQAGPAAGDATGPAEAVVLLHGFPQHWYAWRRLMPELARDRRVFAIDLRGCGWSDAPSGGYDSAGLLEDVLGVLDALGLERVRLVGHQSGGWLGFRLCLAAPERFSAFLAVNSAHPWPRRRFGLPLYAWRYWYTALWEYPGVGRRVLRHWPALTRAMLRYWAGRAAGIEESAVQEFARACTAPQRARAGEQLLWQFVLHDIPALAGGRFRDQRLTVPTLVLLGDRDPVVRPQPLVGAQDFTEALTVRVVPGGHLLAEEIPEVVAAVAREHFGRA